MSRTREQLGDTNSGSIPIRTKSTMSCSTGVWKDTNNVATLVGLYGSKYPRFSSIERCVDENHGKGPYKVGGPLDIIKLKAPVDELSWLPSAWTTYYRCTLPPERKGWPRFKVVHGFFPSPALVKKCLDVFYMSTAQDELLQTGADPNGFVSSDVEQYGATAWNKFKPGKPGVDLGVSIAEAKEIPKMLHSTAKEFARLFRAARGRQSAERFLSSKRFADDWLNYSFGWVPFLSDLTSLYKTHKTIDTRMQRLTAYNGRWERRGGVVLNDSSTDVVSSSSTNSGHYSPVGDTAYMRQPYGSHQLLCTSSKKVWFVGKFRYYIPNLGKSKWQYYNQMRKQYGFNISPELVYNITPWSWLVDWFSNVGDVVANHCSVDNLVAKYAYVMGTTSMNYTLNSTLDFYALSVPHISHSWNFQFTRKRRAVANPFGFGLTFDGLSLRQMSILAALGLSRR